MAAHRVVDVGPVPDETAYAADTRAGADVRVERVADWRGVATDWSTVPFGSVYSDHMLVAEFREGRWGEPSVRPYGPLPLPPSIGALQYGQSVFEGLKAHRAPTGDVLLFRPL